MIRARLVAILTWLWPGSERFAPARHICHSIREWCLEHGCPCAIFGAPSLFAAIVPQGRVYGKRGVAVLGPGNEMFAELSMLRSSRKIPPSPSEHRLFRQLLLPRVRTLSGTAAVLAVPGGATYYHWLYDVMPRLELLRLAGTKLDSVDHFIVNDSREPFQQMALKHFRIDARTISLNEFPHVRADRLVAPSMPGMTGEPDRWVLEFLRDSFLSLGNDASKATPERFYVSRADARHRRLVNEEQVVEHLSALGFRPVWLERMSFAEQIALFRNAEAIIGVHGAGLANLVFCNPGTKVLEIFTPGPKPQMYAHISELLGLDYSALIPASAQSNAAQGKGRDVKVTLQELDEALEMFWTSNTCENAEVTSSFVRANAAAR
ncbi:MAG: glycosyltransferase family 61 protein [Akkermansiaceae bacterium]|nr:glycosyltransferase family 61 protein [Verrucomicrobiales bacterium]